MKHAMIVLMLAAGFGTSVAHADAMKPAPGFDRVGRVSADVRTATDADGLKAAPGEASGREAVDYAARKREMARRLVWLLLSAR